MFVVVILTLQYPSPTNCEFLSIEMRAFWSIQHFTKKISDIMSLISQVFPH